MGAVASGGVCVINDEVVSQLPNGKSLLKDVIQKETAEIKRREAAYRDILPEQTLVGKVVIVVDDGLATGATMKAAIAALRKREVLQITVAVPIGPDTTCAELQNLADEVICLVTPSPFYAVGQGYEDFSQVSDEEVRPWN